MDLRPQYLPGSRRPRCPRSGSSITQAPSSRTSADRSVKGVAFATQATAGELVDAHVEDGSLAGDRGAHQHDAPVLVALPGHVRVHPSVLGQGEPAPDIAGETAHRRSRGRVTPTRRSTPGTRLRRCRRRRSVGPPGSAMATNSATTTRATIARLDDAGSTGEARVPGAGHDDRGVDSDSLVHGRTSRCGFHALTTSRRPPYYRRPAKRRQRASGPFWQAIGQASGPPMRRASQRAGDRDRRAAGAGEGPCYTPALTAGTERSSVGTAPERARDGASRAGRRREGRSRVVTGDAR